MKWLRRLGVPLVLSLLVHLAVLAGLGYVWSGQDRAREGRPQVQVHVLAAQSAGGTAPASASAPVSRDQPQPVSREKAPAMTRAPGPLVQAGAQAAVPDSTAQAVIAEPGGAAVTEQPGEPDPAWQGQLQQHLQAHMRYPRLARLKRQEGVAELHFEVGRDGDVLSLALGRSSGYPLLDEEALALISRAQPLPPPPVSLAGSRWAFEVPVSFTLR